MIKIKKIKNYKTVKVLGSGKFSEVFLVENEKKELRAMKQISKKSLENQKLLELIKNEVEILKACDNPNIIKFYEFLESSNNIYIITEYCRNGDMKKYLNSNKKISEEKAVDILKQLLNGFQGLHRISAIHRDFKPANILVDGELFKIGDFGLSKIGDIAQTYVGTILYMAPEIIKCEKYDSKVDIWSLGAVFYEILFGEPLFANTEKNLENKILEGKKIDFSKNGVNISNQCKDLLSRMIERDPAKRISWKELHAHSLLYEEDSSSIIKGNNFSLIEKKSAKVKDIHLSSSIRFYNNFQKKDLGFIDDEEEKAENKMTETKNKNPHNFNIVANLFNGEKLKSEIIIEDPAKENMDELFEIETNKKKDKKRNDKKRKQEEIEKRYIFVRNLISHIIQKVNESIYKSEYSAFYFGFLAFLKYFEKSLTALIKELESIDFFELKNFEKFKKSNFFQEYMIIMNEILEELRLQLRNYNEELKKEKSSHLLKDLIEMIGDNLSKEKFWEYYQKIMGKFLRNITNYIENLNKNYSKDKKKISCFYLAFLECYLWHQTFIYDEKTETGFDFEANDSNIQSDISQILENIERKRKNIEERKFEFFLNFQINKNKEKP